MTTRSAEVLLSPPSYARVGDVLAGKYRIERVLGRGGMGIVVAASHVKLRQTVAIKFLLPGSLTEPQLATRLLREARAAAALKGEHVARVFDVDVVDGAPYIVMEYLEGQTLALALETGGPLVATLTVDYALEACEALAEAHALGIVHRDLKPSNLFLARGLGGRQTLRVLDFGISKAFDAERADSGLGVPPQGVGGGSDTFSGTDSHALVGSPPYVSPEQLIRPREADARSDIWSLGVVLYQCLSGRLPFKGVTLTELWDSILRGSMPAFGEPAVPTELTRIVRRCLEKDPAHRYADVRELARELAPLGSIRARSSLEVIEGLGTDHPAALGKAEPSVEGGNPMPEPDATLTEAPTTREQTPNGSATPPSFSRFRTRAGAIALASFAVASWAFIAFRPAQRDQPLAQPALISPAPVRVPEVVSRPEKISTPPADVPAASIAVETIRRPVPHPAVSLARTPAIHRESLVAAAPSAAAVSSAQAPSVDVLARAEALLGNGQISEACAVGQVAAATAPDSPRVLEFLGRCYMRLGSADQARAYYRRYLEVAPSAPNAAFVRAMLEPRPR